MTYDHKFTLSLNKIPSQDVEAIQKYLVDHPQRVTSVIKDNEVLTLLLESGNKYYIERESDDGFADPVLTVNQMDLETEEVSMRVKHSVWETRENDYTMLDNFEKYFRDN